jgi:hypothetical protein
MNALEMTTLRDAMSILGLTASDVAKLLGRPVQSVKQMCLDRDHRGYRPPPAGWQRVLAEDARARSDDLKAYADELEQAGAAD